MVHTATTTCDPSDPVTNSLRRPNSIAYTVDAIRSTK